MTYKKRLALILAGVLAALGLTAAPAFAAGPSGSALPAGYVGFWEHEDWTGIKSMYYMPANGTCITLPHGVSWVGNKVTAWWSRAPGKRITVYDSTGCTLGTALFNFTYETGSAKATSLANDKGSSFKASAV